MTDKAPGSGLVALVLAAGKMPPELAPVANGATNRALIPLGGRPMLDYVLDAVRDGLARRGGGRVLVAGDGLPLPPDVTPVAGGASLVDTLLNGVAALQPHETRLLVTTSDIPFLTGEAVADFLTRGEQVPEADFAYGIVPAGVCRAAFPEMKRTTLKVAEGEFTGGNLVLLNPSFLRREERLIRDAYDRRKSVPALARLLGPGLLLRLVLSRALPALLPIPYLEREVGRALGGAVARAVVSPFAEVGSDVDGPDDVLLAEKRLSRPAPPTS